MAWNKGEIYRCPDPECGGEIRVARTRLEPGGAVFAPTCSCGRPMELKIAAAGGGTS
jgi:hypothetical protein